MNMKLVDVTIHIDENVDHDQRDAVQDRLRSMGGVVAAASHDERPHLMVVEYDPDRIDSQRILSAVRDAGVHAELIGL
jgi:hypothetical protein